MSVEVRIHILNEERSPASGMTSWMWCDASCIELFDGTSTPDLDYCFEAQHEFATCVDCRREFEKRTVSL